MILLIIVIIAFAIVLGYGAFIELKNALLPAVIIGVAIFLSQKNSNDSEKSAHYKRSTALIISGVIVLVMGIAENLGGTHHGLYDEIVIGNDPTLEIIGSVLAFAGLIYTAMGYMRYGHRGKITKREYKQHRKNLIRIAIIAIIILLVAGAGVTHYEWGRISKDSLEAYREEIIGKTYEDTKPDIYMEGWTIERRTVVIINDEKLEFTESKGTSDKKGNIVAKGSISNTDVFSYELKKRIDGKLVLYFNGKSHKAYFNEKDQSIIGFKLY